MTDAVITGATGFLGSHFVLNFVGTRFSRAYLLVRDGSRDRLRRALEIANEAYPVKHDLDDILDRVTVVDGDITSPELGLDSPTVRAIADVAPTELWHFAASLGFEQRRATEIDAANLTGTANVLAFAKQLGILRLYHCSTAYVCGTKEGLIRPELHHLDAFNNHYEQTKNQAEHFLLQNAGELDVTVLRPSVVIGHSQTKRPGGASTGIYGVLRELHRIKDVFADESSPTRLWARCGAVVNLIPVDEVMRQIRIVVQRDIPGFSVHQLVSAGGPTNSEFRDQLADLLQAPGLTLSDTCDYEMSGVEELLNQRLTFYQSYLRAERTFEPSVADAASVTSDDLRGYLHEGIKKLDRGDTVFRRATLTASDGVALNTYRAGRRGERAILICNAVGMPADIVAPLAARLARIAPVLTWESRGLPSRDGDVAGMDVSLARQAQDGVDVLAAAGVTSAVVIGWCAGARLALELAARWRGQVRGLVLLNGGYNMGGGTTFEAAMNTIMPKIADDRGLAEVFHVNMFAPDRAGANGSAGLLRAASADDAYLASLPFHNPDNLYRYARLTTPYIATPFALSDDVRGLHALVMTGNADTTASPESSHAVAELMPSAEFVSIDGADHYSLYWDDVFMQRAATFAQQRMGENDA